MNKTRFRLRKQFVIAIPIFLALTIISLGIILTNRRSYSATIAQVETQKSNVENEEKANILADNEYIKNFGIYMDNRQKDNTIIYYADKFHLNTDKVLEIARNLTNNYTNEKYLKTNVIGSESVIEKLGSFKSFEAGAAYFARDIYRNPKRYGATAEEIQTGEEIDVSRNIVDKKIYMSNGLTFEQYYGKIADLFEIDKSIALSMVYLESGRMRSALFNNKNNIGGMRSGSGWMSFPTLEAGIIAHVLTTKSIADRHDFNISDPDGIYKFSGVYVNGSVNKPSDDWTNKVLIIKGQIEEKDVFTIK